MRSCETPKKITILLSSEQERDLHDIRNEFDEYKMNSAIDKIFTYALDGMGADHHAEDASTDHWCLTRVKKLAAILLQPGIKI